jgi:predicted  nucleic acid-binding Zn-ribbon protein
MEESMKKKEKKIHEYKYKINDLQKSKHVLSFRTTEMRKSLEPKEAQIEKLKEELFKLEGEFENMLKTSQSSNDKMKKN